MERDPLPLTYSQVRQVTVEETETHMQRRTSLFLASFGLLAAVLLAGCGGSASGGTSTTAAKADVKTAPVAVKGTSKTVLVDANTGRTLYIFVPDNAGKVNCTGGCAKAWPPLKASSNTPVGDAATLGTFGIVTGDGGAKQVTYNGVPLYFYANDKKAGDANGEGVNGVWFVATPKLQGIGAASSAAVQARKVTLAGKPAWVLTNSKGMTLYWYKPDTASKVACTGGCAKNWPPLAAPSGTLASANPVPGTLGTIANPAGGSMLTYNGHPLYTYIKDKKPGDVVGETVGNVWFAATPDVATLQ